MKRSAGKGCCQFFEKYGFLLILLLYPMRHICFGLDFADTAYNYANFRYMGTEHMDSMWLFSTYLATAAGHLLTWLPGGHTLLFMNFYTGLFASLLAVLGYLFCKNRLGIPGWLTFAGEFTALSLCWCPTSLLYNYLTYLFFFGCIFLLYEGLTREKAGLLVAAGVLLGSNVFVRFSNLAQAALILAVWGYGILCRKKLKTVAAETGLCAAGYTGAVVFWLGVLSVRYGFSNYAAGIGRLLSMTDTATDYKAVSMLAGMWKSYADMGYWVLRIGVFFGIGLAAWLLLHKRMLRIAKGICAAAAAAAVFWLCKRGFCTPFFYRYDSMLRPATLFLLLALFVCVLRILQKKTAREEKLAALLIMLQVLLSAIGSNNLLYPTINSMFLTAPYVLFCLYRFCRQSSFFPAKPFAVLLTGVFLVQSVCFGAVFVFGEPTGVKNLDTKVENNAILRGIYTTEERAGQMEELSAYVTENGLTGGEVILYGNLPSLSFYLEMPSAFNPWSDLASYSTQVFKEALSGLQTAPTVILDTRCGLYLAAGEEGLVQAGYSQEDAASLKADEKLAAIAAYMERQGYTERFANEKFVLYRIKEDTADED